MWFCLWTHESADGATPKPGAPLSWCPDLQHHCNTFMLAACLSVAKLLTKRWKEGLVLAHGSRVYSIVVGEDTAAKTRPWQPVTLHPQSGRRKRQEAAVRFTFSVLLSPGPQPIA